MNNKENLFIIRTYTKAELAHLYNPTVCIKVALQILRRWILFNIPLLHELEGLPCTQPPALSQTGGYHRAISGRALKELFTIFPKVSLHLAAKELFRSRLKKVN